MGNFFATVIISAKKFFKKIKYCNNEYDDKSKNSTAASLATRRRGIKENAFRV